MRRFLGWLLVSALTVLCGGAALAADESDLRSALDRLTGEWSGEVQVKAMDGFVLKTFTASRRASWADGMLSVETALKDGSSEYVTHARQGVRLGRLESSVTRPAQPEDRYLGEIVNGALVWTNAEGNRRDAREQVFERGGELQLETSSIEPIRGLGLSGLVRVEGKFRRPAPARVAQPAPAVAADGADLAALQRELAEARQLQASLRQQLDDAERRVAQAESRGRDAAAAGVSSQLEQARARITALEQEQDTMRQQLAEAETRAAGAAREADQTVQVRRALEARVATLESDLDASRREQDRLRTQLAGLEQTLAQALREAETLSAANQRLEQERTTLLAQARDLEGRLAVVPPVTAAVPARGSEPAIGTPSREQLVSDVQQMERRLDALESERNTAREQAALAQKQVEETRRLRDETLLRFQAVVSELNAMREEKERLARANVSLQAEVRSAQLGARNAAGSSGPAGDPSRPVVGPAAPATTLDGRTADMVIAGLQIIGVTRGEGEDKAILDGRVYRNGDLVEAQLGIIFLRIEDNALVFQDRRGREYRRRF